MTRWKYITKRTLFAAFAFYLLVSASFAFLALTRDPGIDQAAYAAGRSAEARQAETQAERNRIVQEAIERYKEKHNLDEPVLQRYVNYMGDMLMLEWGTSEQYNRQVTAVLEDRLPATLAYVVPGMVFALVAGIGIGVYGALNPGSVVTRLTATSASFTYGLPNFWIAEAVLLLGLPSVGMRFEGIPLMHGVVLPAAILGLSLTAGQLRYARAESREYVGRDFVKLVRAKGASNWRVARHVVRNAALPLMSMFFAELLGVLVVNIFILEQVLGIQGIGFIGIDAVNERDLPLVMGLAMLLGGVGVAANWFQDMARLALDPKAEAE